MRIRVLTIGRPKLSYAKTGVEEYGKRITRQTRFEIVHLRSGSRETESRSLLDRSKDSLRVALDERGALWTTAHLSKQIGDWQLRSAKAVDFLIGGADGHTDDLRTSCDLVWALSPLTLQHELALLVVLEQIYRAFSILEGSPYHRE
jgi:23S rRNA (pseudouridine1915-N3)-methyltransferase